MQHRKGELRCQIKDQEAAGAAKSSMAEEFRSETRGSVRGRSVHLTDIAAEKKEVPEMPEAAAEAKEAAEAV